MQKRKINKLSLENISKKNLSIQFSLDGFSFCISDAYSKSIVLYSEYIFDNTTTSPEVLLEKIEHIFSDEPLLKGNFETVNVIHQNQLNTLVPSTFFDESKLKEYLDFNIKTLATDFITHDTITNTDINNVYIPYVNINNFLFQKFGEFEYAHHTSILIEKLLQHSKNTVDERFYVHVRQNFLDLIVSKNGKLLFSNSFEFNTKEDFIYYILFTAEQLELNPEKFQLELLGDIEEESELYTIVYNYVRNVSFYVNENPFFSNSNVSPHSIVTILP